MPISKSLVRSLCTVVFLSVAIASAQTSTSGSQKPVTPPPTKSGAASQSSGMPDAPAPKSAGSGVFPGQKEKVSYALGMNLGTNLHQQQIEIDPNMLLQGLKDAMSGNKPLMTEDEARAALMQLQSDVRAQQQAKAARAADTNKKEGDAFLALNKTKEGVVTLPSGLQYKVLKEGTGPKPTSTDTVVCNYRGTLLNGTEFDSSYKRGQPSEFPVNGVIRGWTEALQLMPVGSKWQLFIPSDMAYGERGAGQDIAPNATLIFEVELLSIKGK